MASPNVDHVLSQLRMDEKIALLSGIDFWHTKAIPRLDVPSIRMTDGPNGARGPKFFGANPAACLPCGTALGATWDQDLLYEAGRLLGQEALSKGSHVLLGPTVNMQRSPLGGRGFESFSEDPVLSGLSSAAIIKGVQFEGVAATVKHFVCNDSEHERLKVDAIVSERALREIYLMPFQLSLRDAQPMCVMTSYNRVNGTHASENPKLLKSVLREDWGFDGLTMSDWFGTYSSADALEAGLDLEMPGPPKTRGEQLSLALNSGKLSVDTIDDSARRVLQLVKKVQDLEVTGDDVEPIGATEKISELLRRVATSSIALLRNEGDILPFEPAKTTAVIGPNAKIATFCGGGSASLLPYYAITPFDGIASQAKNVQYALGATAHKRIPALGSRLTTSDGNKGFKLKFYSAPAGSERELQDEELLTDTNLFLNDYENPKINMNLFFFDLEATFTPDEDGDYTFGLVVSGTAKLFIDGELVIDNATTQQSGDSFFGAGTVEERGSLKMQAGKTYEMLMQFGSFSTATYDLPPGVSPVNGGGFMLGGIKDTVPEEEIQKAVDLAKSVDQVVICAGLNSEWESEGYDRTNMELPGHINAMISAVCAANKNTAVVLQSGTPVSMPWADKASAIFHAWYGGNETGNAIADVLFGAVNPSGKLSLSFPVRNEDNPAFLNYRSECGRTIYGEDVYVGYRYYEKVRRDTLFPFGHGLSYSKFDMTNLQIDAKGEDVVVTVDVKNTGPRDGAQVVQVYFSQSNPSIGRPVKELKGFAKAFVKVGETETVTVGVSKKYATSFWNETRDMWVSEADTYTVLVGDSSAHTPLSEEFKVDKTSWWKGL